MGVVKEEVHTQVCITHNGIIGDGESANAWVWSVECASENQVLYYSLTWKDKVLECLNTNSSRARVQKQNVGRFQGSLATGSPQSQLPIIFLLLVRGNGEGRRSMAGNDTRHGG